MSTTSVKKESKIQPVHNKSEVKVKVKPDKHSAAGTSAAPLINKRKKKKKKKSHPTSKERAKVAFTPNTPKGFKLPSEEILKETPAYLEFRKHVGAEEALRQTRRKLVADAIRTLCPSYETNAEKKWSTNLKDRVKQARAGEENSNLSSPLLTRSQAQAQAQGSNRVMSGAFQRSLRKAALAAQQSIREKLEELERPMMIEDSPSPSPMERSSMHGSSESPEPIEFRPPQPARTKMPPFELPTPPVDSVHHSQPPAAVRVSQSSPLSGAGPSMLLPRNEAIVTAPLSRTVVANFVQPVPEAGTLTLVHQVAAIRTQSENTTLVSSNAQAGPSSSRIYETDYPAGGDSYDNDGYGIFVDPATEDGLEIWIDPMIPGRIDMIKAIQDEGGTISAFHTEETTHLIILSPGSTYIFDMYCHPEWLSMKRKELIAKRNARSQSRKRKRAETEDISTEIEMNEEGEWQRKVLLKSGWVEKCIEAGRFLGAADQWGGFRAGGPPPGTRTSSDPVNGDDATSPDVAHPNGDETQPIVIDSNTEQTIDVTTNPSVQRLPESGVPMDMGMEMDIDMDQEDPKPTATTILEPKDAFTTIIESVHEPAPEPEMISLESLVSSPPPDPDTTIQSGQPRDISETDVNYQPEEDDDDSYEEKDAPTYEQKQIPSSSKRGGFSVQGKAAAAARARWDKARQEPRRQKTGNQSAKKRDLTLSKRLIDAAEQISQQPIVDFEKIYLNDAFIHGRAEKGLGAFPIQEKENVINEASVMIPAQVMPTNEAGQTTQEIVALPQGLSMPDEPMDDSSVPADIIPQDANIESTTEVVPNENAIVEPVDPSIMFSNCNFWVDTSYPDRSTLTRKLKAAGGSLCSEYSESTHVLIHNYKSTEWSGIVEGIVKDGIWFLHILWAIRSLEAGRNLSEEEFAVPGGNPLASNEVEGKPKFGVSQPQNGGKAHMEAFMSSEKLTEIFEKESGILQQGQTQRGLAELLVNKYKTYKAKHWLTLFNDWRKKQGRFSYLAAESSNLRTTPTPIPDKERRIHLTSQSKSKSRSKSTSPVKQKAVENAGATTIDVENMMNEILKGIKSGQERKPALKEATTKYGVYSYPILKKLFRHYRMKTGPFAVNPVDREPLPEHDRPLVSSSGDDHLTSTLTKSGSTSSSRAGSASVAGSRQTSSETQSTSNHGGKAPYMTSEEVAKTFAERFDLILTKNLTASDVGCIMREEFPGYSMGTWTTMYLDWKNGRGSRFSHLGPYAFVPLEQLVQKDITLPPSKGKGPKYSHGYTDEEDRAMAAYLVGKPDLGRKAPRFWQDFHKQYPARSASGYSQHYHTTRTKIDRYVKEIEQESRAIAGPANTDPVAQKESLLNAVQGGSQEDPVFVNSDNDEDDGIISISHSPIKPKSEVISIISQSQYAISIDNELNELTRKEKDLTEEEQEDLEVGLALMAQGDQDDNHDDDDVVYVPSDEDDESDTTQGENYE